jgi:hypothetical protein
MTPRDIFSLAAAFIASLGGGAFLVFAFSSWLGKVWANRILEGDKAKYANALEDLKTRYLQDTEKYKTSLKKSEFIFEKEYQAASEFVALLWSIHPTSEHQDMDWDEACDQIAFSFDKHETTLRRFLAKHGAVLSKETRNLLGRCISLAADGKFRVGPEIDADTNVLNMADCFYTKLCEVEQALLNIVRDQSRI